jgi:hypothetical protein
MRALQRKLMTAPLPVVFAVHAVLFGVLTYLLGLLVDQESQSWIGQAIGGLLFGVLMTAWIARERRRTGGPTAVADLRQVVRTGELPDGAEPDEWRPRLERQRRIYRWMRFVAPVEFAAFAALGIWLSTAVSPVYWVFVAVFVGFGVWGAVASVRGLGRIERLLRRLDATSDAR